MKFAPAGASVPKFVVAKEVFELSFNGKYDSSHVDAQSNIGISKNPGEPPVLIIQWYYEAKANGKSIIDVEFHDQYLCADLSNYETDKSEWNKAIASSYSNFNKMYSDIFIQQGCRASLPIFGQSHVDKLRENLIRNLKKRLG